MTSQQIEYVLTLAQLRSFSKAAQKLYVTQPSLSQYIMSIERQLGTALFDRSTSPISLTRAGEAFVRSAEKIRTIEENLRNELADLEKLKRGTLRIGASSFRASCLLAKSIYAFCDSYGGIEVSVTEGSTDEIKALVRGGELDVAVGTGSFDPKHFHTEELADERLYVAVPQNSPINEKLAFNRLEARDIAQGSLHFLKAGQVSISEFADMQFVTAADGEFSQERLERICEESGFAPGIKLTVRTIESVFAFVNAGVGIALIPDTLIRFGNLSSQPCYYAVDSRLAEDKILLISKKNGYFSEAAAQYSLTLKKLVDIGTWRI